MIDKRLDSVMQEYERTFGKMSKEQQQAFIYAYTTKHDQNPIRSKRYSLGKTQKQLAKDVKVTQATMSRWEQGHRMPSPKLLHKLARQLKVDSMQLYVELKQIQRK